MGKGLSSVSAGKEKQAKTPVSAKK